MYSYYPRHGWSNYRPYRYCYKPYYYPYNNFFNSRVVYSNQSIYNSGIMNDIFQQSIISQTADTEDNTLSQEPKPDPTPPTEPAPIPPENPIPIPPENIPIPPENPNPIPPFFVTPT